MVNEERIKIRGDVELGATIAYLDKKIKRPLVLLISGTGNLNGYGNSYWFIVGKFYNFGTMIPKTNAYTFVD